MTQIESCAWLRWLNSMFRHDEKLVQERGALGLSAGICLYGSGMRLRVSWPTVDFCMFGSDPRLPRCRYTSMFEMADPRWKYYGDMREFAENNQWMKPYAGCASQEELMLRISINRDDLNGLLPHGNRFLQ